MENGGNYNFQICLVFFRRKKVIWYHIFGMSVAFNDLAGQCNSPVFGPLHDGFSEP
ncbi:conserved hypothetical protein [delta proteobacterium NaphS2]|nr:conserved hypothetical protein [delta proteobacterium NaphS2]